MVSRVDLGHVRQTHSSIRAEAITVDIVLVMVMAVLGRPFTCGYVLPGPTQPSVLPGSVNEYCDYGWDCKGALFVR